MRKPEQLLWDAVKRNKPSTVQLERIESGVSTGTPDVHGIEFGTTVWFELKQLKLPKRDTTRLIKSDTFAKEQIGWHLNYAQHGGTSFALIRDDHLSLYLIPGRRIREVQDWSACEIRSAFMVGEWSSMFSAAFNAARRIRVG